MIMNAPVTIAPSQDFSILENILSDADVFRGISDDSHEHTDEIIPNLKAMNPVMFAAHLAGQAVGMFVFIPAGDGYYEAHTLMGKKCRGTSAIKAAKMAISSMFLTFMASGITSFAFSDSPSVIWFCRVVGLTRTSEEDYPNTRSGKIVKLYRYLLTKEEWEKSIII